MLDPRQRLIVALDVSSAAAARKIVAAVGESAEVYKVGMQLFTAEGPAIVRDLVASRRRVFLDLKYHDIPNTVGHAVREAAQLGVSMLTVHASGGENMLAAAAQAGHQSNPNLMLLAVTVLTSFGEEDLCQIGVTARIEEQALRLARYALNQGFRGVVASAREAPALRKQLGRNFAIVTPGVRPQGSAHDDQARVVTPAEALLAGATFLVIGRPITAAHDPGAEARAVLDEIASQAICDSEPAII
jgi:orotidine-5'-phosphate decarboxylase